MSIKSTCIWCGDSKGEHKDGCPEGGKLREDTTRAAFPYMVKQSKDKDVNQERSSE